jgi:hypothetical protein
MYRRAITTLFCRVCRMIDASLSPARAAAVANPLRNEWPAKSPSTPGSLLQPFYHERDGLAREWVFANEP